MVITSATYLPNEVCVDEYFDGGALIQPIYWILLIGICSLAKCLLTILGMSTTLNILINFSGLHRVLCREW